MRKCARIISVLVLGLVFAATAEAQQLRIGYVDMKKVLDNAPQVLAGRARLDQEFRARNDAIELDEVRANALEARLAQGDVSADGRVQLERDLRETSPAARKTSGTNFLSAAPRKCKASKNRSTSPCRKSRSATDTT
jgi:Skp family chaperone for outer membrane proteins